MQTIRTIAWMLVAILFAAFVAINWQRVEVNFWPLADGYLHFDWPVGFVAIISFLIGLIPMWLLGRATRWALNRRIATLENSLKAATVSPPIATSTQFEAANAPLSATSESPTL
jgi:lipopolysaccharide assembly protein A